MVQEGKNIMGIKKKNMLYLNVTPLSLKEILWDLWAATAKLLVDSKVPRGRKRFAYFMGFPQF